MNFKKINERIEDMFERGEFDTDFIETNINKINLKKLYDYQILHVYNLITCLKKINVVIDGSSTGTGKTYTTACVCKELRLQPVIICPKSIMNIWRITCDYFDVKPLAIVNYETIRSGQMYDEYGKRVDSEFLKMTKVGKKIEYKWDFGQNTKRTVIVFDEAHRCKNKNSINGQLLLSTKNVCKTMLLSATISDTVDNFTLFGYLLGFYKTLAGGRNWAKNIEKEDKNRLVENSISTLNKYLFPHKGSRMNVEDLGESFPKNNISVDSYTIDKASTKKIDDMYIDIREKYKDSDGKELVVINKARQTIELLKVPILYEQTEKYLENNKSVAIFVNFTDTLNTLSKLFTENNIKHAVIHGKQTSDEREIEINKFQTNTVRVIICMITAGSVGISLHDTSGMHGRVSLICPSFSSTDLIQTLGRIYRTGIIQPVLQKIIYCADTYEDVICRKVKEKIKFINYLSDEDLVCF